MQVNSKLHRIGDQKTTIGLGCSRLGSVLGATPDNSVLLIKAALDLGVTFFDTADIYGQGQSEEILGRVIGRRSDIIICSKIGKRIPRLKAALVPLKAAVRVVARSNAALASKVKTSRAQPFPTDWSRRYLLHAIDRGLRRLGRDQHDILMLHSPSATTIRDGDAIDTLVHARADGKIAEIGISVDSPEAAAAALRRPEVSVLQIPLHPSDESYNDVLSQAQTQGVAVIAREVLGGPRVIGGSILSTESVQQALQCALQRPEVSVALIGTTKISHLTDAVKVLGR